MYDDARSQLQETMARCAWENLISIAEKRKIGNVEYPSGNKKLYGKVVRQFSLEKSFSAHISHAAAARTVLNL